MPQERPNPDWVVENGAGLAVKSFRRDIAGATRKMLQDLPHFQANIQANVTENRAVYEIVDIFAEILGDTSTGKE